MPALDLVSTELVAPQVLAIIAQAPRPGLGDTPKCAKTRDAIEELLASKTPLAATTGDPQSEALALSGLWLLAGELDRSHTISQSVETAEGSYWHGIMHRREGDFWNSKYWFRRVGRHSVLAELVEHLTAEREALESPGIPYQDLLNGESLAEQLVDLCQTAVTQRQELSQELELIFWWEWQLLFRYSLTN